MLAQKRILDKLKFFNLLNQVPVKTAIRGIGDEYTIVQAFSENECVRDEEFCFENIFKVVDKKGFSQFKIVFALSDFEPERDIPFFFPFSRLSPGQQMNVSENIVDPTTGEMDYRVSLMNREEVIDIIEDPARLKHFYADRDEDGFHLINTATKGTNIAPMVDFHFRMPHFFSLQALRGFERKTCQAVLRFFLYYPRFSHLTGAKAANVNVPSIPIILLTRGWNGYKGIFLGNALVFASDRLFTLSSTLPLTTGKNKSKQKKRKASLKSSKNSFHQFSRIKKVFKPRKHFINFRVQGDALLRRPIFSRCLSFKYRRVRKNRYFKRRKFGFRLSVAFIDFKNMQTGLSENPFQAKRSLDFENNPYKESHRNFRIDQHNFKQ